MTLRELYHSVSMRWRPEDVAGAILEVGSGYFDQRTLSALRRLQRRGPAWSSMTNQFSGADGLERMIATAGELFPGVEAPVDRSDPAAVRDYIDRLSAALRKGDRQFHNRLDRRGRLAEGLEMGHRAYNKRFRLIERMEAKYERWLRSRAMRELAQIAKTRLACEVRWSDFSADLDSACFVAWMTARLGLRSTFTWGRQQRAFDEVADLLLDRCLGSSSANFWAIALVHPAPEVLERLSEGQRGRLTAMWFQVMRRAAEVLEATAAANDLDLRGLVVRKGNDSSSWNEAAGAFNVARDGWIGVITAMGMEEIFDHFVPGKALRLMAADVVAVHRAWGSGRLEPDTEVWNELPLPWQVVLGPARCTRADIDAACRRHGVAGKGWLRPRETRVEVTRPTPELVHDMGRVQPGDHSGLALEPRPHRVVAHVGRVDHLDRHLAVEHHVSAGEDHPMPPWPSSRSRR